MMVECVQIESPATRGELIRSHPAVHVGKAYLVIGLSIHWGGPPSYQIIDEYGTPSFWPMTMFNVVDGRLPSGWVVQGNPYGIRIGPEITMVPGFWERYWDGDRDAELSLQLIVERGG